MTSSQQTKYPGPVTGKPATEISFFYPSQSEADYLGQCHHALRMVTEDASNDLINASQILIRKVSGSYVIYLLFC